MDGTGDGEGRKPRTRDGDDDHEREGPVAKPNPPMRFTASERFRAFFDDFPELDPWQPTPSEVHRVWKAGLSVAAFVVMAAVMSHMLVFQARGVAEHLLAGAGELLCLAGLAILVSGFREARREADPALRERRWRAWKAWTDEVADAPRRRRRGDSGREYWMERLAMRVSRLERLVQLDAPPSIIANERKLVRDAIAHLDRRDADAMLRAWPVGSRLLRLGKAPLPAKKGTDKPN